MRIFAVILAGGEGSRLGGVNKGALRFGGTTMLERITARLGSGVEEVLVSSGPNGKVGMPDLESPAAGPLAGIAAAVARLREDALPDDILVSVAVDTPFLPSDFVGRLVESLEGAAAYAAWGTEFYPTNAVWRFSDITDLPERMEEIGSPRRLLAQLAGKEARWDEEAENPFANLNTLGDLVALSRRLK